MTLLKTLLFVIGFIIMLGACNKNVAVISPNTQTNIILKKIYIGNSLFGGFKIQELPEEWQKFETPSNIFFTIQSNIVKSPYAEDAIREYLINGWVYTVENVQVDGGIFSVETWEANLDENNQVSTLNYMGYPDASFGDFFSESINVSLEGNGSEGIPEFNQTISLPVEISLESPVAETDFEELSANQLLSWNADPLNPTDVIYVEVAWDGGNYDTPEDFGSPIANVALVEDNGELILTSDFFDGIPDGGVIRVVIRRGIANVFDVEGNTIKIIGVSSAEDVFVYRN